MLLLEVDIGGRPHKLEAATPAGLLTLHPEGGTLHGNVVRAAGIEHLALPWRDGDLLLLGASPVSGAVAARDIATRVGVGEGTSVAAVEVGFDLAVRRATWRVARTGERRWWLLAADGGSSLGLELDEDGVPVLDGGVDWPLERAAPAG